MLYDPILPQSWSTILPPYIINIYFIAPLYCQEAKAEGKIGGARGCFSIVLYSECLLERTGFVGDMRELLEIPHRMVIGRVIYVAPGVNGRLAVKERHAVLRLVGRAVHSIFRNRNFRSFAPVGYLRK